MFVSLDTDRVTWLMCGIIIIIVIRHSGINPIPPTVKRRGLKRNKNKRED